MREDQVSHNAPDVTLALELDSSLDWVSNPGDPLHEAVCREISWGLAEILETLGIPGMPRVQITAAAENTALGDQCMRVFVNDQWCRCSDELLQRVHSYVREVPLGPEAKRGRILAWPGELSDDRAGSAEASRKSLVASLRVACLEIIKRQPAVLLGLAQVVTYRALLPDPTDESDAGPAMWPPDPAWLLPILCHVLDLKISIADRQAVTEVLKKGLATERSQKDIAEDLIDVLRTDAVEIQLPQGYLRQITTADAASEHDKFTIMRDGLFYEWGLHCPTFRFVPVEHLKPYSFAFKINHLTTLPRVGLQADQCLVNDTPQRLRLLNIQGTPAINPANGNECSLIDLSAQAAAVSADLTTWNQLGYLVLCFVADIRENSVCVLHRRGVQHQLEQLEEAFPALVEAVQAKISVEQITRVLRSLIAEEISIRDLRLILEWLLNYDYIITDPAKYIIFDDRLPTHRQPDKAWLNDPVNLTSFVRIGMKRYISHKYTRGQSTLIVYLLDPEIERMLSPHPVLGTGEQRRTELAESARDKILEALRDEVGAYPLSASAPVILTTIDVRPALRDLIAHEFPRLPVLAYQELSPEMNIQPIARISLNT